MEQRDVCVTTDRLLEAMASGKSLLDVAKSLQDTAAPRSLLDVAKQTSSSTQAPSSGLSLVDIARQDVTAVAPSVESAGRPLSLERLANEINDEERTRVGNALATAASDVRTEQREHTRRVLDAAVAEVRDEEANAAKTLIANVESRAAPLATAAAVRAPAVKASALDNNNSKDADDGYSSFGDDDDDVPTATSKAEKAKPRAKPQTDNNNESDDDNESYNNAEKTTASDAPVAKAFLRAVYRADMRTIHDMLDNGDVSATVADQVRTASESRDMFLTAQTDIETHTCCCTDLRSMAGADCTGQRHRVTQRFSRSCLSMAHA